MQSLGLLQPTAPCWGERGGVASLFLLPRFSLGAFQNFPFNEKNQ